MSNIPLCVCVCVYIYIYICIYICICIFFIQSSVNAHLGCFHVLAIVNSVIMNIGIYVSFRTIVFFRYMPRSGIAILDRTPRKALMRCDMNKNKKEYRSKLCIYPGKEHSKKENR